MDSTTYSDPLRKTHMALSRAGKLKAAAIAIGERRRWKGNPTSYRTVRRWEASVVHMLDRTHPYQYALEDHLIVRRILGHDPVLEDTAA